MVKKMRKVVIFCILLLLILSAAPFIGACITKENLKLPTNEKTSEVSTESTTSVTDPEDDEYIINLALSLCDENFCDEGIKAALGIAKNNYRYFIQNSTDKDNITPADYSDEIYQRAKELYSEVDITLEQEGNCVYIPTSELSNGNTGSSEKYPYMTSVASPWDALSGDYVFGKEYAGGVSMYGLNYLCENNADYKEALKWYLPSFDIK